MTTSSTRVRRSASWAKRSRRSSSVPAIPWGRRYASPWQLLLSFGWFTCRLRRWLGLAPKDLDADRYFCSELVAEGLTILRWVFWSPETSDPREWRAAKQATLDKPPDSAIPAVHRRRMSALSRMAVQVALDALPAEQRVVVALFSVDGLSHGEIAAILGVPEGTVWSRLHKGRKALAAALK